MALYQIWPDGRMDKDQTEETFKVVVKNNVRALMKDIGDWEQMTVNRSTWKKVICKAVNFLLTNIAHNFEKIWKKKRWLSRFFQ